MADRDEGYKCCQYEAKRKAMCEEQCVSCVTILEKMTKVLDKVGEKSNNETSQIYIFSKITGHFGDSSQCLQ